MLTNKRMTKKKMISFCNTAWPQYSLDSGERWPKNGSLNYNTILQLDLFCKKEEKRLEIEYVQAFMLLYQRKDIQRKCNISAQGESPQNEAISPGSDDKTEDSLSTRLNTATPPPSPLGGARAAVPPRSAPRAPTPSTSPPDPAGRLVVSPSQTCQVTPRDEGGTQPQAGRFPGIQWPIGGVYGTRQLPGVIFVRPPLSTSDLLSWKVHMPTYRDDPIKMESLFASIFALHHPTWADIQILLNVFLTSEERSVVLKQARAEAEKMREQVPNSPVRALADVAVPAADPRWSPADRGDRDQLEHYRRCILRGLRNGVPKHRSFDKVLQVRQRPDEDPFDYLERLFKAYRQGANIDPQAPEHLPLVNASFVRQAAPDIQRKLQRLRGALGMPTLHLAELASEVFRNRDKVREKEARRRMRQQAALLADAVRQARPAPHQAPPQPGAHPQGRHPRPSNSRSRGHPNVGPHQCAYCKRQGHWKKECPSLNK